MKKNNEYIKNVSFTVESNISDNAVEIPDSKARLIYREFIEKRNAPIIFSVSISVFITTMATILTASFVDVFNIDNSRFMIKGIFIFLCFSSLICSVVF